MSETTTTTTTTTDIGLWVSIADYMGHEDIDSMGTWVAVHASRADAVAWVLEDIDANGYNDELEPGDEPRPEMVECHLQADDPGGPCSTWTIGEWGTSWLVRPMVVGTSYGSGFGA